MRLRNRIPTAFMPRIAAQYAPRRERATAHCPMLPQGVNRIVATARPKAAVRADQWADRQLIGTHRADRRISHDAMVPAHASATMGSTGVVTGRSTPALRRARLKSSRRSRKSRPRVASRPISTRSTPDTGCRASSRRAASFSRRRVRLRTTALPTFLVTVKPIRAGPGSGWSSACSTSPWVATFLPFAATRKNSARRFRRAGEGRMWDTRGAADGRPSVLRRRAACGPWRGGSPPPGGRRRWPSGNGTRGGACGQASTVDRCASRLLSRLIEPA
jgi:hypothetical protein